MQYHIQTTPIWDAFRSNCDCPLCEIYSAIEARLVSQYLNEAVMEPEYRVKVNERGFCAKHLTLLFSGKNKLGLALQLETRTRKIIEKIKVTDNIKQASSQAEQLLKTKDTCVICDTANEMMERYCYTIAQMFAFEAEFPKLLTSSRGFCLPHYALLLQNAAKAGSKTKEYLMSLTTIQKQSLETTANQTQLFTQRFDYRNAGSGAMQDSDAVPKAINKLKGKLIIR